MISGLPAKLLSVNQAEVTLGPEWFRLELDCDFNNIRVRSFILNGAPAISRVAPWHFQFPSRHRCSCFERPSASRGGQRLVCTENLIRVDGMAESPKLTQ